MRLSNIMQRQNRREYRAMIRVPLAFFARCGNRVVTARHIVVLKIENVTVQGNRGNRMVTARFGKPGHDEDGPSCIL